MIRILFLFALVPIVLPSFVYAQGQATMQAPIIEVPETLGEAQDKSLAIGEKILCIFPGIIKNIWNTQVLPVWTTMWQWAQNDLWGTTIQPKAQNLLDKGLELLGREVEQRKPIIEQELQQEKEELAQDIAQHGPGIKKGLWKRFLDLFDDE